jgi:ATP-dependent DNA helicase
LEKYIWQYIILDEGHRIKNRNCKLLRDLKTFQSISRLLLTGTPIQNSLEELWSLLNFCSPAIFDDLEIFKSWFDFRNIGHDTKIEDILGEEQRDRIVSKLHEILRPFVLRRFKKDTIGDLVSSKREIVIYCGMSSLQSDYYARVLDGSLRDTLVATGVPNAKKISQINMTMNLRKVCNHPFLFGDLLNEKGDLLRDSDPALFIMASGKFQLLDRMLPRLNEEGHKIIIFSQMTEVLNLLEDFLLHREFSYVRFDGATKLADRQASIDQFNNDENTFIFLLSTRAGGLGINLTAADTVILFDSDWNPHVDSQAQDRCHRIGQSNDVIVYRLLTLNSVEIDMMKKQLSKKKLERLTIHGGDFRRAGRRQGSVSIEDLRKLLEDDVRSIVKKDTAGEDKGWLNNYIDDEELDLIMNRLRIFSSFSVADSDDRNDSVSSVKGKRSRGQEDTAKRTKCQELLTIPTEGEMYDFVNLGVDEVLANLA